MFLNHDTARDITFTEHPDIPAYCTDSNLISFMLGSETVPALDFTVANANWNSFGLDVNPPVDLTATQGSYAGTVKIKDSTGSFTKDDITFDLHMCLLTAPTTFYDVVFFDANSDGNVDSGEEYTDSVYSFDVSGEAAELAIPMVLRFNDVTPTNSDCGALVYEATVTHSSGFDVLSNGGTYDDAANELTLTNRANYDVGEITVIISVYYALDPNEGKIAQSGTIYVIDCIDQGNSMTVTSSYKD